MKKLHIYKKHHCFTTKCKIYINKPTKEETSEISYKFLLDELKKEKFVAITTRKSRRLQVMMMNLYKHRQQSRN